MGSSEEPPDRNPASELSLSSAYLCVENGRKQGMVEI